MSSIHNLFLSLLPGFGVYVVSVVPPSLLSNTSTPLAYEFSFLLYALFTSLETAKAGKIGTTAIPLYIREKPPSESKIQATHITVTSRSASSLSS